MDKEKIVKITQSEVMTAVTVKEFIDILSNYDPDSRLFFKNDHHVTSPSWISSLDTTAAHATTISISRQQFITPAQIKQVTDILNNSISGDHFIATDMAINMSKLDWYNIGIIISIPTIVGHSYMYTITKEEQFADFCYQYKDPMPLSDIKCIFISINYSHLVKFKYNENTNKFCYTDYDIYSPEWQTASKEEDE